MSARPAASELPPAAAVAPPPPVTSRRTGSDLAEVLREPTLAATKGDALVALLGLWRADPTGAQLDCEAPSSGAIECLATVGTWRKLRQLDLPAALELTRPDGERRYGVLAGLTASEATLRFGDRVVTAPLSDVERFWDGAFIVLWRPPPVALPVRVGARGPAADWLRERLARVEGTDPSSERGRPYDDALLRRVVAFQRGHLLKSDGVVGRETAVLLQRAEREADVPRLSTGTP
jgi:general secretion pathway protein A